MFRDNWRSPAFWRTWWRSAVPAEVKVPLAFVLVAMLLLGGYFAAGQLGGASAANSTNAYVLETTVRKVVTVRDHGKLLVRRVPVVVRRVVVQSRTAYQTVFTTKVVTTKGGVRRIVREVPRFVPVERVVKVTNQSTVVVNHTATVVQPVTSIATITVSLPPNTVTETRTVTETVTVSEPTTVTVTVTTAAAP